MPIDYRLPALRRRRSSIIVKVQNQQEIIDAAQLDDKSAATYMYQIQNAQAEFDELEFVIEFFEHYTDGRSKIPVHPTVFIVALAFWAVVTVAAVLFLR